MASLGTTYVHHHFSLAIHVPTLRRSLTMKDIPGIDEDGNPKNGPFKLFFKNGLISCQGEFDNGKKSGKWKYFLNNGPDAVLRQLQGRKDCWSVEMVLQDWRTTGDGRLRR